jgi:hypothetical protein
LSTHPQLSPSNIKETNFFTPLIFNHEIKNITHYDNLFAKNNTPEAVCFEATPSYFLGGKQIAPVINRFFPESIAIVILRNPTDRFISSYNHFRTKLDVYSQLSLQDYFHMYKEFTTADINSIDEIYKLSFFEGHYSDRLNDWISEFGTKRVKIYFYEDLSQSPETIIQDISKAVGISFDWFNLENLKKTNVSSGFKNAFLHESAMRMNLKLEPFLNKFPTIKQKIKILYTNINGAQLINKDEQDTRKAIAFAYKKSNEKLKNYLNKIGFINFPNWLEPTL